MTNHNKDTFNVYVSIPLSIPENVCHQINNLIHEHVNANVFWYDRATYYNSKLLQNIQAMIIVLPEIKFKCSDGCITRGVKSELNFAITNRIPFYLAYINAENKCNLYKVQKDEYKISGIAGSSETVYEELKNIGSSYMHPEVIVEDKEDTFDQRLLLL